MAPYLILQAPSCSELDPLGPQEATRRVGRSEVFPTAGMDRPRFSVDMSSSSLLLYKWWKVKEFGSEMADLKMLDDSFS